MASKRKRIIKRQLAAAFRAVRVRWRRESGEAGACLKWPSWSLGCNARRRHARHAPRFCTLWGAPLCPKVAEEICRANSIVRGYECMPHFSG